MGITEQPGTPALTSGTQGGQGCLQLSINFSRRIRHSSSVEVNVWAAEKEQSWHIVLKSARSTEPF